MAVVVVVVVFVVVVVVVVVVIVDLAKTRNLLKNGGCNTSSSRSCSRSCRCCSCCSCSSSLGCKDEELAEERHSDEVTV